jgi:hypothetical protein
MRRALFRNRVLGAVHIVEFARAFTYLSADLSKSAAAALRCAPPAPVQQLVDLRRDLARQHGILVEAFGTRIGSKHTGDEIVEILLQPHALAQTLRESASSFAISAS